MHYVIEPRQNKVDCFAFVGLHELSDSDCKTNATGCSSAEYLYITHPADQAVYISKVGIRFTPL